MVKNRIFLTDKEVATVCEFSVFTLQRIINGFYRKAKNPRKDIIDIMKAEPEVIGNRRRWRIEKVAAVLGVTKEEIYKRIS